MINTYTNTHSIFTHTLKILIMINIVLLFVPFIFQIETNNEILKNPTYLQSKLFLYLDNTDKNIYTEEYNCVDFSHDTIIAANKKGLICNYVIVEAETCLHAIISFNTTDYGMVYFEPQSDDELKESDLIIREIKRW